MSDMQALLEQWAKLEPHRCWDSDSPVRHDKKVRNAPSHSSKESPPGGLAVSMKQDWWHVWDCTEAIELLTVLGAVAEVIEARGWHYQMHWHGGAKIAYVYPPGITQLIRFDTQCMAESLLGAYLQALKLSGVGK